MLELRKNLSVWLNCCCCCFFFSRTVYIGILVIFIEFGYRSNGIKIVSDISFWIFGQYNVALWFCRDNFPFLHHEEFSLIFSPTRNYLLPIWFTSSKVPEEILLPNSNWIKKKGEAGCHSILEFYEDRKMRVFIIGTEKESWAEKACSLRNILFRS